MFDSHDNTFLWHLRLGHVNKNKMLRIRNKGMLPHINTDDFNISESYVKEKLSRKSFSRYWKSLHFIEMIDSNLYGLMRTKTYKGM